MRSYAPVGWKEKSLGELLTADSIFCDGDWVESKDQDPEGQNRLIQLADIGDGRFLDKSDRFMNDNQIAKLRCTSLVEGDILIARMPDPIGRACLFPRRSERCVTVVDVAVLRNANADPHWLTAAINSSLFRRKIEASSTGTTRTRISRGFLAGLTLLVPPKPVQKKVAAILTSIDTAIEKTEALIEKYQQIKAGLMHDLFTCGVLPNGQMRPPREQAPELYQETAIGWIPTEWSVRTLKEIYKNPIRDFGSFSSTNLITFLQEGVPFIKSEMIKEGEVDWRTTEFVSEKVHYLLRKSHVSAGNILFSKIGSALGKAVLYDGARGVCNSNAAVAKIEVDSNLALPEYIEAFLNSDFARRQFRLMIVSLLPRINLGDIDKVKIQTPDIDEQQLICRHFGVTKRKISNLQVEANSLRKQKQGLMQDLLTGKVPVNVDTLEKETA